MCATVYPNSFSGIREARAPHRARFEYIPSYSGSGLQRFAFSDRDVRKAELSMCPLLQKMLRIGQSAFYILAVIEHLVQLGVDHFIGERVLLVYADGLDMPGGLAPVGACSLTAEEWNRLLEKRGVISLQQGGKGV